MVLFVYLLIKEICTWNCTPLAQKSESTRSYGMDYARSYGMGLRVHMEWIMRGILIWGGAYTRSNTNGKE